MIGNIDEVGVSPSFSFICLALMNKLESGQCIVLASEYVFVNDGRRFDEGEMQFVVTNFDDGQLLFNKQVESNNVDVLDDISSKVRGLLIKFIFSKQKHKRC